MRPPRRARFIAATADLSASGKPTTYPDYCVKTHDRPLHLSSSMTAMMLADKSAVAAINRALRLVACQQLFHTPSLLNTRPPAMRDAAEGRRDTSSFFEKRGAFKIQMSRRTTSAHPSAPLQDSGILRSGSKDVDRSWLHPVYSVQRNTFDDITLNVHLVSGDIVYGYAQSGSIF